MKKLVIPSDVSFHPGPRLMIYRPRGILSEDRVEAIVEFLKKAEDKAVRPFNRFTDLSKLDALDLDFKTIIRVSLNRRLFYSQHPPVKSAFYVTSPAAARVVKVHAILTDHSPLVVKMFKELGSAAKWLDVSLSLLQAQGKPHNGG
jgi:hypothetical protein